MKKVMVAILAAVLISCGGSTGVGSKSKKSLEDSFNKLHDSFTESFDNQGDMDSLKTSADSLVLYLKAMVSNYPESESLSGYCFAVGEVSMKVERGQDAIKYFDTIESKYPEDENVSKALYLKGYTFENILTDTVQAIAAYKHLYKTYPESEWSQNAKNQVLRLNNPGLLGE